MEEKEEVVLDGNTVTKQELEEKKQDPSIRIAEDKNAPGSFKTLERLHG